MGNIEYIFMITDIERKDAGGKTDESEGKVFLCLSDIYISGSNPNCSVKYINNIVRVSECYEFQC